MKLDDMVLGFIAAAICSTAWLIFAIDDRAIELEKTKMEVNQERMLRIQAEKIKYDLITQMADEWCEDQVQHLYDEIKYCEEGYFDQLTQIQSLLEEEKEGIQWLE